MTKEELYKLMGSLSELTSAFHNTESQEKRVGRIVIPTTESMSLLEEYISRWAWLIVQKGSEREDAPEDMPQIAEADSHLDFRDAVLELVLYGLVYLFDQGTYGIDPIYGIELQSSDN